MCSCMCITAAFFFGFRQPFVVEQMDHQHRLGKFPALTSAAARLGANKSVSIKSTPVGVVIDPAILASSQRATQYPPTALSAPKKALNASIHFKLSVSKYAAAAGVIIKATTRMDPTASKAPTFPRTSLTPRAVCGTNVVLLPVIGSAPLAVQTCPASGAMPGGVTIPFECQHPRGRRSKMSHLIIL